MAMLSLSRLRQQGRHSSMLLRLQALLQRQHLSKTYQTQLFKLSYSSNKLLLFSNSIVIVQSLGRLLNAFPTL